MGLISCGNGSKSTKYEVQITKTEDALKMEEAQSAALEELRLQKSMFS
ncbi:hypothetical protein LX77_00579 [Gelidibacter algens]|uniref:Uncharacterized protein n=1 Tax=Gelidibacter algens TaxID=49280 RepID=A0A327SJC3_9FLAO|nr:hypothetical protein LX77_00579 [Gelidibacter algens]